MAAPPPKPLAPPGGTDHERLRYIESRLVQIERRIQTIEDQILTATRAVSGKQGQKFIIVKK
jgi:hypothetical protein